MRQFLWKELLQVAGFCAGGALVLWAAGLIGLIITLAVALIACMYAGLPKRWVKVIAWTVLLPVIALASVQAYLIGTKIQWRFTEAPDTALEQKPKSETEKLAAAVHRLEGKVDTALEDVAELSDSVDKRFAYDHGRLDALSSKVKENQALLNGLLVPPPPPEVNVKPIRPTFEWVPSAPEKEEPKKAQPESDWEEVKPKGNPIPNTSPKEPVPDLLVRTHKQEPDEPPTHVLGTCGRAHKITGWTADNRPIYGPCRDIAGQPACAFVQFGTMQWK